MPDMPEIEMTEEERMSDDRVFSWTETPEGLEYLRLKIQESEASGPPREVDVQELRLRALARIAQRSNKAA